MKIFLIIVCGVMIWSCDQPTNKNERLSDEIQMYDSLLAAEVGADKYGMRKYIMAFLKAGPNQDQDEEVAKKLQRAHLDNIMRMAEEGQLVIAGPFIDNFEVRGIYIFAVETVEEAETLTSTDPAIQAGRLAMELHPWYGPAMLMKMNDLSKPVIKEKI